MKYTLRTLWFFLKQVLTPGKKRRALKETKAGNYEPSYKICREMSIGLLNATGARVVYHGLENLPEEKGVLFVSNHQSLFDIPILFSVMEAPTAFVSKKELRRVPGIGLWIRMIGGLFMDREDVRQSMQVILDAGQRLKDGLNMVIYPEGTRSQSDEHGEFKLGALKPASIAKTSIVPVFVDGSHRIFESNKGIKIQPAEVHVYIGKPIAMAGLSRGEQKALFATIEDIVFNLPNAQP